MKINYNKLITKSNTLDKVKSTKQYNDVKEIVECSSVKRELAKVFKMYRTSNNYYQDDLAKLLDVNPCMISKYENGSYNPTIKQLIKISYKLSDSNELFISICKNVLKELDKIYPLDKNNAIKLKITPFSSINLTKNTKKQSKEEFSYVLALSIIANVIKTFRLNNNLTQNDIASKLNVNQVMISKLEKGTYNPSIKLLIKISYGLTNDRTLFNYMIKEICKSFNKEALLLKDVKDSSSKKTKCL